MLTYIKGDLLKAFDKQKVTVIGHCCNCQNVFGAGIAADIRIRYPQAFVADHNWYKYFNNRLLEHGDEIFELPSNISIAKICNPDEPYIINPVNSRLIFNLYGQQYFGFNRKRHVSYPALTKALIEMREYLIKENRRNSVIGFPKRMASYRAGGDWNFVEQLIGDVFNNFNVHIYDFTPSH